MLGKLIKYEFKATGRSIMPIYIALFVLTIIGKLLWKGSLFGSGEPNFNSILDFFKGLLFVIYIVIFIASSVVSVVVIVQRFYKNLLRDEGYLMNTLPVKPSMNIASKLITSVLWTIICSLISSISIAILAYDPELVTKISNDFGELINRGIEELGGQFYILIFELILLCLMAFVLGNLIIYLSLIIGHLFNKYKIILSFLAFIVITIGYEIISTIFAQVFLSKVGILNIAMGVSEFNLFMIMFLVYIAVLSAGIFVLCSYLLKNKLNLE